MVTTPTKKLKLQAETIAWLTPLEEKASDQDVDWCPLSSTGSSFCGCSTNRTCCGFF